MRYFFCTAVFCLLVIVPPAASAADQGVTFASLLDEMLDRDAAASFPVPAYTCSQASSYDRASTSSEEPETWMANNDRSFFIRSEENDGREEWVMMDAEGPGCIVRWWITSGNPAGNFRIYLDGAAEPVINEPAKSLLGGDALGGPPLTEVRARGYNLYVPIPYATRCKVTYDRPNFHESRNNDDLLYYQINYRTYDPGTQVESFSQQAFDAARQKIASLQDRLLVTQHTLPPDLEHLKPLESSIQPGGHISDSVKGDGGGAIHKLRVRLAAEDLEAATRSTVLSLTFDGQQTVWCPVGDFFGSGVGVNPFTGWWRQVDEDGWMTCYWVMPYKESCEIKLENLGQQPVDATIQASCGEWTWDERSMYFHTNWRQQYPIDTAEKHDWNYVEIQGRGVYMGDTLCVNNPVRAWWGEGDEKIYVDGEAFPSHFGTGTEDYYGYAWCTPEFFDAPFHAQPLAQGPGNQGHVTNTRVRLLDGIPFTQSLKFDMEVWHWRATQVAYAATTHWYGLPGARGNFGPDPEMAKVFVPEGPKPRKVEGAIEGEDLKVVEMTGGEREIQDIPQFNWSGWKQIWWKHAKSGDRLVLELPVEKAGTYRLSASLTKAVDYGIAQLSLDGKPLGEPIDFFHDGVVNQVYALGTHQLDTGSHKLSIEITGSYPKAAESHMFGIDYLKLDPVE